MNIPSDVNGVLNEAKYGCFYELGGGVNSGGN